MSEQIPPPPPIMDNPSLGEYFENAPQPKRLRDPRTYHVHDQGPGPWLQRITGWDLRYTICEGRADDGERHWRHCHVVHVAATMWGVRRRIRARERERGDGRGKPFWEYPSIEVRPCAANP